MALRCRSVLPCLFFLSLSLEDIGYNASWKIKFNLFWNALKWMLFSLITNRACLWCFWKIGKSEQAINSTKSLIFFLVFSLLQVLSMATSPSLWPLGSKADDTYFWFLLSVTHLGRYVISFQLLCNLHQNVVPYYKTILIFACDGLVSGWSDIVSLIEF